MSDDICDRLHTHLLKCKERTARAARKDLPAARQAELIADLAHDAAMGIGNDAIRAFVTKKLGVEPAVLSASHIANAIVYAYSGIFGDAVAANKREREHVRNLLADGD